MQAAELLVHVDQAGGHPRQAAVTLVGCVGDINCVRYRFEKALETAFDLTLFRQFVKLLFGLDYLLAGLAGDIDRRRLCRDVAPQRDQVAAYGQIIDHLRVIAHRKGRDRSTCKTGKIGRTAKLLQPLVVFHERLERHRRGKIVLGDARGGDFEYAGMYGVVEMARADDRGDAVVDVVIGENRTQKLLLGLDRMGHGFGCLHRESSGVH